MSQIGKGKDETIIEPLQPIIDAHHHLFDRPPLTYLLKDYLKDARSGHNIIASVYVETQAFISHSEPEVMRPVGEVEFANGVAAMSDSGVYGKIKVADGIVGYADLRFGEKIAPLIDTCLERAGTRFKGVRQNIIDDKSPLPFKFVTNRPPHDLVNHPDFTKGLAEVEKRHLTFDIGAFHHQLPQIAKLADAFPDLVIVLNNMGHVMALGLDEKEKKEALQTWRNNLRELAKRQNVVCKIGGLGLPFFGFNLHERKDVVTSKELVTLWRPYIETAIEAFSVERSMMESDYPMDGRSCGYVPLWNALKLCVSGASKEEKDNLFYKVAARTYRINIEGLV
ncbi:amidohydrolase family protein [Bartonella apihabitans]|uniref:amidohydrolase family protein n=1 Tax=uncultured Bartonella sp. TaxID=104108 RepID=UPI0025E06945|nr:amidohydrolase family protein [Bartonella apihabitans]WLT08171.1 amidohydrolase family protein [Bartonella apihabitans]